MSKRMLTDEQVIEVRALLDEKEHIKTRFDELTDIGIARKLNVPTHVIRSIRRCVNYANVG